MELSGRTVLIIGGAGFIGSHLSAALLDAANDVVADDLSNGTREWVPDGATLVETDLTESKNVERTVTADIVFHLAAQKNPNDDDRHGQFAENTAITHLLLEQCRSAGVGQSAFASSSTVYGEAPRPTPEGYAPLKPISVYGASKLGEDGLVSTYAHSHGLTAYVFRFANIVGPRLILSDENPCGFRRQYGIRPPVCSGRSSPDCRPVLRGPLPGDCRCEAHVLRSVSIRGAVIPTFIEKLRAGPEHLTILENGRQEKSYMYVDDCVHAMRYVVEHSDRGPVHTYNLGTSTTTSVDDIAEIVSDVLDVDPIFEYTGGNRGWTGNLPKMRLAISKLLETVWEPDHGSDAAVRRATEELAREL